MRSSSSASFFSALMISRISWSSSADPCHEVGELVKGLLAREGQPNKTPMDAEVVRVLRREVESFRRATENLPQPYLKLENGVQA